MTQEVPEEPVPERLDPTVVGVLGAGVIGTGVAHSFALAGHRVVLVDIDRDALDRTREHIDCDLRVSAMLENQDPDPAQVTARITAATDVEALRDAAFVVENVTENWETKRRAYSALDAVCPPACVYIANTSAFPITRIASVTNRPDRVVGAHFMNPIPRTKAVELIAGHHTSPHSIARVRALLATLGKTLIEVGDSCGFVSNRVLMLSVNEAAYLVYENVADAATVDRIFRDCFGHAMGPLETADLIGLDTVLHTVEVLHTYFADSKYRPCPLLRQMVDAGLLGRKSGVGFHNYAGSQAATHRSAPDRAGHEREREKDKAVGPERSEQRDQAGEQRRESIRSFLLARFAGESIADDEDIFDRGFVNSLFALELVMHLERTFQIRLPNEVLRLDNFRTVAAMSTMIENLAQDGDAEAAGGERR